MHRPMPSGGLRGWIGPLLVTVLAGVLRFVNLGRPDAIIFDETYYVKDALALLRFGYERQAVDGADDMILAQDAAWNQLDIFKDAPSFVVHPPLGKWVIAAGEWAFGVIPFGWRFGVAVLGTLSVLMTARIIRRLTRSDLVGTVAGLLVALDGLHIVMSRTALLDMTLMFFVLAAFGFLLLDRDAVRRRADAWRTLWEGNPGHPGPGVRAATLADRRRRCRSGWPAGSSGAASGTWPSSACSASYWDLQVRRELGRRASRSRASWSVTRCPAFLSIVVVGLRRLPGHLDRVARHRRRLRPQLGRHARGLAARPRRPAVPGRVPPRRLGVPRRAGLAALLQVQRVVVAGDVAADVVLLRVARGRLRGRPLRRGGPRARQPDHLVGRPPGPVPQRLARRGRARLAQRRPAGRLPGRLAAVDGLPRADHLHVLRDPDRPLPRRDARHLPGQPRRWPGRHRVAPAVGDPGRGHGPAAHRRRDLVLPAGLDRAGAALRALGLADVAAHLGLSGRVGSRLAGLVRHHRVEHRPLGRSGAAGHQRDGLLAGDPLGLERRHPSGQPGGVDVAAGPVPGPPAPRA